MSALQETPDSIEGQSFRYHFLGQGAQYRVYALLAHDGSRTGRVIKMPLSLGEIEHRIAPHVCISDSLADREHFARIRAQDLLRSRQTLPKIIGGVRGDHTELMRAIGDLKVLPQTIPQLNSVSGEIFLPIIYTQQEVTPISFFFDDFRSPEDYPGRITTESIRKVHRMFRKVCQLHMLLWNYGFFESSFNIRNMGYASNGRFPELVLLDTGEMLTEAEEAQARLAEKPWLYNMAPSKHDYHYLPPVLHNLFQQLCQEHFTSALFHKHWQYQKKIIEHNHDRLLEQQELQASSPEQQVYFWVRRQNLAHQLYQGMVDSRVEQIFFDPSDLRRLQDDIRQSSKQDARLESHERALASVDWQPTPLN